MDGFASQQDEGYSEAPLNQPLAPPPSLKLRDISGASSGLAATSGSNLPEWLMRHISTLSLRDKTNLAMALLSDLPTGVVVQVVEQLNPRLYIDFIRCLPVEVCLKILGYLDPVSLIHVAMACHAWYEVASDRRLWQALAGRPR
ncbi:hypothetical protein VTK73DRAFT_5224 [Phialemonium thermophilum]|uniref:F-box domain-containing protein n=1 Tax=Phialemonium thermophilum TaxID=223376 RepID=A0ABR3V2M8_9PEZI